MPCQTVPARPTRVAYGALVVILVAAAAPYSAWGQTLAPTRLSNGIQLFVAQSPRTELEVVTQYLAGFRDEPDSLRGLAHLLEHLAMREIRGGPSIAVALAQNGWSGGASTSESVTSFVTTAVVGSDSVLARMLQLERLRMTDLEIAPASLEVEKRRIAAEVGARDGNSNFRAVLFPGSRLSRASSHRDLSRITAADARAFYAAFYSPGNSVITIASSLPVSAVQQMAERILAPIPSRAVPPRPVARDSTRVYPGLAIAAETESSAGGIVAALSVPGVQDSERLALEREVEILRRRVAALESRRQIDVDLTDDAPVSLLRVRVRGPDTLGTRPLLDSIVRSLADSAPPSRSPTGRVVGRRSAPSWVSCEAAGDWRYCLDVARARDTTVATDEPLPLLSRVTRRALQSRDPPASPGTALWPAPTRNPITVSAEPTARPSNIEPVSQWIAPDTIGIQWSGDQTMVRWVAAPGGRADTVFFAAWVVAPPELTAREVSSVEVLARSFGALRLPNGLLVADSLSRLGGSVSVRPLPYPPLATNDAFRIIGTAITPLGVAGLQITGAVPSAAAREVVRLVGEALTSGRPDSIAVQAELQNQTQLLAQSVVAPSRQLEVAFRRSAPALPSSPAPTWRPEELPEQLRIMQNLSAADVENVASILARRATARLAILGVDATTAAGWIASSAWAALAPLDPPQAPSECAASPAEVSRAGGAVGATANVYFALCIPSGAPLAVPASLLLASAIIGGREDAVLAKRLRGETGLAYQFENRLLSTLDGRATLWYLHVGTQSTTVDAAISEVRNVLGRLSREGVGADEVATFRDSYAAQRLARGLEGRTWVTTLVSSGLSPEQEATRIRSLTAAEVNAVFRHWDPSRLRIVAP